MKAILTGDIIHSRQHPTEVWQQCLKEVLGRFGAEPADWMIFRGDSFQLRIDEVRSSLSICMSVKAGLKRIRNLDARMALGLGLVDAPGASVAESSGEGYIRSGRCFDHLKDWQVTLACESPWPDFDEILNPSLALAAAIMDRWLPTYAEVMYETLLHPEATQKELGELLGIAQNTVSERQGRSEKRALFELDALFRKLLARYL